MLKRVAKWASIILVTLAMVYFVDHAWRTLQGHDLSALVRGPGLWGMVLLTLLYAAAIVAIAAAWLWQLRAMGEPATYRWAITVLAVTQFGKYLPGNVGHHIGRVGLAIRAGIGMPAAVLTIGYELLIAVLCAAHVSAIAILLWPPGVIADAPWLAHRWPLLGLVTIGAVAGLLLAPRLVALVTRLRVNRSSSDDGARTFSLNLHAIVGSYAMYACGQMAIGVGMWSLAVALSPTGGGIPSALFFAGAFATSWIAGLIVPGAPAGLGIREVVLTAWLTGALSPPLVVVLVVALRIATTIGDALNFALGSWALARMRKSSTKF